VFVHPASAQVARYGFGTPATPDELTKFFSIPPDGSGLPSGSGNAKKGAELYALACAACHGEKLEGNPAKGIGGDKLLGGRSSLATKTPVKTVESYWPYAGSLSDNDIYSVVAYILSEAKIIKPTETIDAKTLPAVAMPNKDGFMPDPRPEVELYR
jgi:cytochrome c